MSGAGKKDLIVLVADADALRALREILARPEDLGIRSIEYAIAYEAAHDAACRLRSAETLRTFLNRFRHALVIFDRHGCSSKESRDTIQKRVTQNLRNNGWRDNGQAIVIEPELEAWVWGSTANVARTLGWEQSRLERFLEQRGFLAEKDSKPPRPKEAFEAAVRKAPRSRRKRVSPRLFGELAEEAPLDGCRDPAFRELRETLRTWFPPEPPRPADESNRAALRRSRAGGEIDERR